MDAQSITPSASGTSHTSRRASNPSPRARMPLPGQSMAGLAALAVQGQRLRVAFSGSMHVANVAMGIQQRAGAKAAVTAAVQRERFSWLQRMA